MNKKILITALTISLLFSLTSCGDPEETEESSTTASSVTEVETTDVPEPTATTTAAPTATLKPTATPTPKPATATPKPTATPTPTPTPEPATATPKPTATPTPKPTATPVPEPTDPPTTPTPVPEPEPTEAPTEPEPTEPGRDLYAEIDNAVSYAESLGYTITDVRPGYGFVFMNATGTYKGVVTLSGDKDNDWILSYAPVDRVSSDYSYYDYTPDIISAIGNIDSDYLYF